MPARVHTLAIADEGEAIQLLRDISAEQARMGLIIGQESPDGRGGTGLVGRMMRVEERTLSLESLKLRGWGIVVGALFAGGVLVLGVKSAVPALFGAVGVH